MDEHLRRLGTPLGHDIGHALGARPLAVEPLPLLEQRLKALGALLAQEALPMRAHQAAHVS